MNNLANECTLSFYEELTPLNTAKTFYLVKNIQNDKLYVKKTLTAFHLDVYQRLKQTNTIHIPHIYEIISCGETCTIIEEYIHGDTLTTKLTNHIISPAKVTEWMLALCQALKILHTCDPPIIHRDIKPDNIMISNDGILKLIDFNISRTYSPKQKKDTEYMGTAGYAAPEQYGYLQTDARTDIYSCGVLFNYMLTKELPSDTIAPSPYAAIIKKCISLDPKDRYQSVMELEYALQILYYNITGTYSDTFPMETPSINNTANDITLSATTISDSCSIIPETKSTPPIKNNVLSFLPPGFRRKKPLHMIIALLGYISILSFSFTCDFKDTKNPIEPIYDSFLVCFACLATVAYLTNYLNIQDYIWKFNLKNKFLRFILHTTFAFVIFCGVVIVGILFLVPISIFFK